MLMVTEGYSFDVLVQPAVGVGVVARAPVGDGGRYHTAAVRVGVTFLLEERCQNDFQTNDRYEGAEVCALIAGLPECGVVEQTVVSSALPRLSVLSGRSDLGNHRYSHVDESLVAR